MSSMDSWTEFLLSLGISNDRIGNTVCNRLKSEYLARFSRPDDFDPLAPILTIEVHFRHEVVLPKVHHLSLTLLSFLYLVNVSKIVDVEEPGNLVGNRPARENSVEYSMVTCQFPVVTYNPERVHEKYTEGVDAKEYGMYKAWFTCSSSC